MDSVTQFALGSAVGLACLGRRTGPRKAALLGGVLGTLPDLDVFIPVHDPVDAFVSHRGASHSLIAQAVATPLIGEITRLSFRELRDRRMLVYLAVYLCLATHALLDGMTVYGTRLLWPLWPEPVGLGSIFIIDPLFTLPLVIVFFMALFQRRWRSRFTNVVTIGLVLPILYLGWSAVAQQIVHNRAEAMLDEARLRVDRILSIPTPFNTLYWRAIVMSGERYLNLYLPILGGQDQVSVYAHPSGIGLVDCLRGNQAFEKLADFSDGFYRIDQRGDAIAVSDLRMGLTPNYAFQFLVADNNGEASPEIYPIRSKGNRREPGDLKWLAAGAIGGNEIRQVEKQAYLPMGLGLNNTYATVDGALDAPSCRTGAPTSAG